MKYFNLFFFHPWDASLANPGRFLCKNEQKNSSDLSQSLSYPLFLIGRTTGDVRETMKPIDRYVRWDQIVAHEVFRDFF